jgi:hypothetical protein
VQVVWLGVLPERGQIPFLVALVGSGVLGWALHRVLTATAVGSVRVQSSSLGRAAPRWTDT